MNYRYLSTPWAHRCDLYSPPGSLVVKIALGEAPDAIPTTLDVRFGVQQAATRLRIGAVDQVLQHFAQRIRITRVHTRQQCSAVRVATVRALTIWSMRLACRALFVSMQSIRAVFLIWSMRCAN